MNMQLQLGQSSTPPRVKLTVAQFWFLKQSGAFPQYEKTELIEGEMSGVPRGKDGEPESDASIPIKLRVKDYLLLAEAGLLIDNGKTQLIDGILYEMSPQHRPHWYAKNEMTYRLRRALEAMSSTLYVGSEGSVMLSEVDLLEPDIIVTGEPMGTGPIPLASVRLLVEIADSTRILDFGIKAQRYAAAGVPEYWVLDISRAIIRQLWEPRQKDYSRNRDVGFGSSAQAATILGLHVDVPSAF